MLSTGGIFVSKKQYIKKYVLYDDEGQVVRKLNYYVDQSVEIKELKEDNKINLNDYEEAPF